MNKNLENSVSKIRVLFTGFEFRVSIANVRTRLKNYIFKHDQEITIRDAKIEALNSRVDNILKRNATLGKRFKKRLEVNENMRATFARQNAIFIDRKDTLVGQSKTLAGQNKILAGQNKILADQKKKLVINQEKKLEKKEQVISGLRQGVEKLQKRTEVIQENRLSSIEHFKSQNKLVHEKLTLSRKEHKEKHLYIKRLKSERMILPGDNTTKTTGFSKIPFTPSAPFVKPTDRKPRVLLLNSMGGSMGKLTKGLLLHQNIEADCVVNNGHPRPNMVFPHETNAFGIYTHSEWKDYLVWAIENYDIIQTSTLPMSKTMGECYDWLTEKLGARHIWRSTGFIHHYIHREDILPLDDYRQGFKDPNIKPDPERLGCSTFSFKGKFLNIGSNVVLYSSPEKGAYLKGKHKIHFTGSREPEVFKYTKMNKRKAQDSIKIYVPHHSNAFWKGLDEVIAVLEELKVEGYKIDIITSGNATDYFPELRSDPDAKVREAYPIENHMMPQLMRKIDIVIDQIVMGAYGNTGVEAMLCGRPVIGQKRYSDISDAPLWDVKRDNLKSDIAEFLDQPELWQQQADDAREYAILHHTPKAVAASAAKIYDYVMDM